MLSQRNTNSVSEAIHVQEVLEPEPRGTVPESPSHIDVSGATCEVKSRQRPASCNQTSIVSIPEPVTKILQSLVELKQTTALQSSALHNLKSRALASSPSPSKSLLKEIEMHYIGMENTLAVLIALGCKGSPVAMQEKEELKLKLRSNIEDIKHVLTNASTSGLPRKVISVEKPGEVLDSTDTVHHTDINGRRVLYPFLAKFQLVLAAKFVPSACPGQSGQYVPLLKQPSAEALEG